MSNQSSSKSHTKEGQMLVIRANYELFVFALVIYQFINSILIFTLQEIEARNVVILIAVAISIFLLIDAFSRLLHVQARVRWFFKFQGYLVFLGSLPIPLSPIFRLIWYRITTRRLTHEDFKHARQIILEERAQRTLLFILLAAITVLEVSSIAILYTEVPAVDANIRTASDAIWWSLVTIATVGYGDVYPVTNAGRVVGTFVIIGGVALFSVLTSYLAQWFLRSRRRAVLQIKLQKPGAVSQGNLEEIQEILDRYDKSSQETIADLRERIAQLESHFNTKE